MKKQPTISNRARRDILQLTAKLGQALEVPLHFIQADATGVVWLEQGLMRNPFCKGLNRGHEVCRRCASACFPSSCVELAEDKRIGVAVFRMACDLAVYLVTPVSVAGSFCGVLGCGPVRVEKPTRQKFQQVLEYLNHAIPPRDHPRFWRAYSRVPLFQSKKTKAITSLLPEFAELLGSSYIAPAKPVQKPKSGEPPALVDRMLHLIRSQGDKELTLSGMAQQLQVSEEYLSRHFHQIVGVPFHIYVNRARVARAKVLMTTSSSKCLDIAFEAGFKSKAAFNRWFLKLTGKTPRQFRHSPMSVNE